MDGDVYIYIEVLNGCFFIHHMCVTYFIDGILMEKDIDIVVYFSYLYHMDIYIYVYYTFIDRHRRK